MFSIPHFSIPAPGVPCDWSFVTVHFNTYIVHQSFGFMSAESNKHVEHVRPFYNAPFDVLTFDILTSVVVFEEVGRVGGGLKYLKRCLQDKFVPNYTCMGPQLRQYCITCKYMFVLHVHAYLL